MLRFFIARFITEKTLLHEIKKSGLVIWIGNCLKKYAVIKALALWKNKGTLY